MHRLGEPWLCVGVVRPRVDGWMRSRSDPGSVCHEDTISLENGYGYGSNSRPELAEFVFSSVHPGDAALPHRDDMRQHCVLSHTISTQFVSWAQ